MSAADWIALGLGIVGAGLFLVGFVNWIRSR